MLGRRRTQNKGLGGLAPSPLTDPTLEEEEVTLGPSLLLRGLPWRPKSPTAAIFKDTGEKRIQFIHTFDPFSSHLLLK